MEHFLKEIALFKHCYIIKSNEKKITNTNFILRFNLPTSFKEIFTIVD